MDVEFDLTEDDAHLLAQLSVDCALSESRNARFDWSGKWLSGLFAALWLTSVLALLVSSVLTARDATIAIAVSTVWAVAVFVFGHSRRTAPRHLGEQIITAYREGGYLGHVRVEIDPTGVRQHGPGCTIEADWRKVLRVWRHQRFALIYLSLGWTITVPKRAFDTEADFDRFCRLAGEYRRDGQAVSAASSGPPAA